MDKKDAFIIISVITKGELLAIALQNNWGEQKIKKLEELLNQFITIDINANNNILLDAYAEIDAYSKKRHPTKTYNSSAKPMGQNDLWIAATALATNATLLTTDSDFEHLRDVFIHVKMYKIKK